MGSISMISEWPAPKLYVLVRGDMTPGYQAVQGGHALAGYWQNFPITARRWIENDGHLIYLAVKNEAELMVYWATAMQTRIKAARFYEPDIQAYTAMAIVALNSTDPSATLVRGLPLALKRGWWSRHLKPAIGK